MKGGKFTFFFLGGGFLFGLIRELIYVNVFHNYAFSQMPLMIMNVPITIPMGWVFAFYLGNEFTKPLIKIMNEKDVYFHIVLCGIFADCICIPIETAALRMGWWDFGTRGNEIASASLMGGWMGTTILFFSIFFLITKKMAKQRIILPLLISCIPVCIETTEMLGEVIWWIILGLVLALIALIFYNRLIGLSLLGSGLFHTVSLYPTIPNPFLVINGFLYSFMLFTFILHQYNSHNTKIHLAFYIVLTILLCFYIFMLFWFYILL